MKPAASAGQAPGPWRRAIVEWSLLGLVHSAPGDRQPPAHVGGHLAQMVLRHDEAHSSA
jgi:hypothetical protein